MTDPIDPALLLADLRGQVVLVTGASRGIGRACAVLCARAGATVLAAGRDQTALAETVAAAGSGCRSLLVDVTDEAAVVDAIAAIGSEHGRLDVLINNAGLGRYAPLRELRATDAEAVYRVNVLGPMLCSREALKLMEPAGQGTILMVGSVVSRKGYVDQAAYTASKHALYGLTKTLAAEAQPAGIRVSILLPGGVDTDMAGQARPDLDRSILMTPSDVARAALFLLGQGPRVAIDEIALRRRGAAPF